MALQPIDTGLWCLPGQFGSKLMPGSTRMTVLEGDGGLVLHSPVALTRDDVQAIEAIASLVAPGGDLIVIAIARDDDGPDSQPDDGPPWFLNRKTINKFDTLTGLTTRDIHLGPDPEAPDRRRSWTAHFTRS